MDTVAQKTLVHHRANHATWASLVPAMDRTPAKTSSITVLSPRSCFPSLRFYQGFAGFTRFNHASQLPLRSHRPVTTSTTKERLSFKSCRQSGSHPEPSSACSPTRANFRPDARTESTYSWDNTHRCNRGETQGDCTISHYPSSTFSR